MKILNVESEAKSKSKAYYSSAVVYEKIVYISGRLPMDQGRGIIVEGLRTVAPTATLLYGCLIEIDDDDAHFLT